MHTITGVRPNPAAGRLGHSGGTAPASSTDGLSSVDEINSSGNLAAAVARTNNKEALLSSSDTDDCDAPDKLVIDLDGFAGQVDHCISADTKPVVSVNNNGASASRNATLDGPKSRAGGNGATSAPTDGSKSSAGVGSHHRLPAQSKSAAESTVSENSNPSNSSKGLKMKIKCSQAGGVGIPVRHEVSHFPSLGVPPPPSSASSNSAAPPAPVQSSSAAVSGDAAVSLRLSGADAKPERDAVTSHARTTAVCGSHRKDHRGLSAKDRSAVTKDRSNCDHPVSAGGGSNSTGAAAGTLITAPVGEDIKPTMDGDSSSGTASVIDPYEFNVKTEDSVGRPAKKIKLEKCEATCSPIPPIPPIYSTDPVPLLIQPPQQLQQQPTSPKPPVEMQDAAVDACHVGVVTDPDCLGPCEPGTTVTLEGIVWNETENGLLVVNVTWRGKTYVGTLMDATKHHWAPPRFATESPTSDLDGRTPKGRGKRGRTCATSLRSDFNGSDRKLRSNRCTAGGKSSSGGPGSPARSEPGGTLPAKRPRVGESNSDGSSRANSKSSRSDSRMSNTEGGTADNSSAVEVLKECPAPNCSKKFRHINGLQYHQSRAHPNMALAVDDEENEENDSRHHHQHHHGKTKVEMDDSESVSNDGWRIISSCRSAASPPQNATEMHDQAPAQKDKKSKSEHRSGKSKRPTGHSETAAPTSPKTTGGNDKTSGGEELPSTVNGREKSKHKKKDRHKDSSAANIETSKEGQVANSAAETGNLSESGLVAVIKEQVHDSGSAGSTNNASSDMMRSPSMDNGEVILQNLDRNASVEASVISRTLQESGASNLAPALHSMPSPHSVENITISTSQKATSDSQPSTLGFPATLTEMPSNSSLTVTPSKKPKSTPTKHQPVNMVGDIENPNSPAYSDISDANDSAPMLEKEATPSCAEDDAGNPVRENRPLSRHLPEGFGGTFGPGQASAMLYGQPPCLTPAVIPPGLDGSSGKPMITQMKSENGESGRMPTPDDRPIGDMVLAAQRLQRLPGEQSRPIPITDGRPDMMDRNAGNGMPHRSNSRPHPNDLRSPHSPAAPPPPMMQPANMYMYPYVGAGAFPNFDAALLMQHPDYRARYERLIQQEVARRHDLPAATSRPPDAMPTDAKGYPILPRPGDLDRRGLPPGKSDMTPLGGGSLPTPPSLIPDRSLGSFDDQDGNMMKAKGMDRRDDRMFVHQQQQQQQQYPADRQRGRHDEQMMQGIPGGKDGAGKPSAVVAPQARDRTPVGPGSSKSRPDDSPRPSSDRKPSSSKGSGSSHSDMQPPRTMKDLSDRGGPPSRDDKGLASGRSSGQPFKPKEECAGGLNVPPPPIVSQSLPMSVSFPAPYYPYIPGAPQYAGAPLPFDPTAIYSNMNPIIGYAGAPPGPFLHPGMGYLPSVPGAGDVTGLMQPPPGGIVSPLEGKSRDLPPPRVFYQNDGPQGPSAPSVHKIHELKEVAKGTVGPGNGPQGPDAIPGSMGPGALRDPGRPESRGGPAAGASVIGGGNLQKDHDRGSPPMQRHLHTHHHMHMLGPPFISFPGDPAMMSSPQTTAPTIPRPYIGK